MFLQNIGANTELGHSLAMCLRLVIAAVCGAAIGIERKKNFKDAGLRTHILVCCGAAMFMVISKYGFSDMIGTDGMLFAGTGTADPAADYASIPESGYWTNNVVVCDQNKGSKIRGLLGFGADESSAKVFTTMVNNVKKMVGDKVNVYTLPAPVSSAYYTPKGMDGVTSDQHAATTALSKTLDPSIKNIDAYSALAKHTNEYIYYRTDHHWTTLAAYYATKEFAKAADVPFTELDKMEKVTKTGFTGSMYTYSGCQEFLKYPDTYIYYKPKNQYTTTYYDCDFTNPVKSELFHEYAEGSNLYCTILGTDMTICEMKTDVKNGRTLVLIKDSYGNAMAPYFVGSFEKIYVIDMRYTPIKLKDFFEKVGATDILFGSSISSFYTISRAEYLNGIMK